MVTSIDDLSRYVYAHFTTNKFEVFLKFVQLKALVENQSGKRFKSIRTVNGSEYINNNFDNFGRQSGIIHLTTVPCSLQQNGLAGRINRILTESARSMISYMQVEEKWWEEALNTAV